MGFSVHTYSESQCRKAIGRVGGQRQGWLAEHEVPIKSGAAAPRQGYPGLRGSRPALELCRPASPAAFEPISPDNRSPSSSTAAMHSNCPLARRVARAVPCRTTCPHPRCRPLSTHPAARRPKTALFFPGKPRRTLLCSAVMLMPALSRPGRAARRHDTALARCLPAHRCPHCRRD